MPNQAQKLVELLSFYPDSGGRFCYAPHLQSWQKSEASWPAHLKEHATEVKKIDLYLHLPFCQSLCTFCGCNIKVNAGVDEIESYLAAIKKEIIQYAHLFPDAKLNLLTFGGGTPSFLSTEQLKDLCLVIDQSFEKSSSFYAQIEADPRSTNLAEKFSALSAYGFTRVNFGVQDFDEQVVQNVNRIQTSAQIYDATQAAYKNGMNEVHYDLIYGLPFQKIEKLKNLEFSLKEANPTGVSLYPLAGAPWQNQSQKSFGDFSAVMSAQEKRSLGAYAHQMLKNLGFFHLGFGHYTKKSTPLYSSYLQGKLRRSLMGYTPTRSDWQLGAGVSAISFTPVHYHQNLKILDQYIKHSLEGLSLTQRDHFPTQLDLKNLKSFERAATQHTLPKSFAHKFPEIYEQAVSDQLLIPGEKQINLNEQGVYFLKNFLSLY